MASSAPALPGALIEGRLTSARERTLSLAFAPPVCAATSADPCAIAARPTAHREKPSFRLLCYAAHREKPSFRLLCCPDSGERDVLSP
eukprot:1552640-Pleurochrysis_carterae.AAC.2